MNTAKWMKSAIFTLTLSLALSACSGGGAPANTVGTGPDNVPDGTASVAGTLPVLTDEPYQLAGTEDGAADFTALNTGYESPYANDTCWNITPAVVSENSDFTVFKYGSSNETFVLFDGASYAIGSGFGGDGVTSMALADVTGDSVYDLCYGYSENGTSRVGYFDPAQKTANELSGAFSGQAIVLKADGNQLQVCAAEVSDYESLLSMTLTPGEKLANVVISNNVPELEMTEAAAALTEGEPAES